MTREEAIHIIEKDIQIDVRSCTNEEVHTFITALNMAIAALREQESLEKKQATSDWISVEDRLPEPFVSVFGYCPDEEPLPTVHECYVNGFGQWTSAQVYGMGNVTHWMPLPEPPKEEV